MARKKKDDELNDVLLGEGEVSSITDQLLGNEPGEPDVVEIPEGTTTSIATERYIEIRNAHEDIAKQEKALAKALAEAESILYRVLDREGLEAVRSKSGTTLTAYERKVGSLTVPKERAIEMIKEEGLDRELLTVGIATGELNRLVNKWAEEGVQFPAFVRIVGIPKISINRSKSSK
jgi:hypothetical protein